LVVTGPLLPNLEIYSTVEEMPPHFQAVIHFGEWILFQDVGDTETERAPGFYKMAFTESLWTQAKEILEMA